MPQLIFFAIIAFAAWYFYRRMVNDARQLAERRKAAERENETGAQGTLVYDPETGEYRVRKNGEE